MPTIYLSPSTQEYNPYVTGGNEEYYMNLIADAMEPYLTASGIGFVRNTPSMTAGSSIRASNAGTYDAHVSLHSNASAPGKEGSQRGSVVFYYPRSARSHQLADVFVSNLKSIYPIPDRVQALPTTAIGEVTRTTAPAVLLELAYHDNTQDATWIQENISAIARNLVLSLTEYFGLPFIEPQQNQTATVEITSGNLNIRQQPSLTAPIIGQAPDGAKLEVLGSWDGWHNVRYGAIEGYVRSEYIMLNY